MRPERPFAFVHDGVLLRGRLDLLQRGGRARARRRLQDERPRRADARRGGRVRLPAPAARLRARLLPGGRRRGRGRLHVPRAPRRRGRRRRSPAPRPARSRTSSRAAIGQIAAGVFTPSPGTFTCAGCPALDVVCAGPKLPGGPADGPLTEPAGLRCRPALASDGCAAAVGDGRGALASRRGGEELRPRGAPGGRAEARADPARDRAARGRARRRRGSRFASGVRSSCSSR